MTVYFHLLELFKSVISTENPFGVVAGALSLVFAVCVLVLYVLIPKHIQDISLLTSVCELLLTCLACRAPAGVSDIC